MRRRALLAASEREGSSDSTLITFYIDDEVDPAYSFTAEEGMTWGEFVNSKYAKQNDVIKEFRADIFIFAYHEYAGSDGIIAYIRNIDVHVEDVIENGRIYIWYS